MTVLLLIVIAALLIALSKKGSVQTPPPPQNANQGWVDFIAGYALLAKTKSEKALLARMLADLVQQGMPMPSQPIQGLPETKEVPVAAVPVRVYEPVIETKPPTKPLDNATLLLYFGAFLFLAAAGLFVAFAGASGLVRVAVVFIAMAVLYIGGFWLNDNKPKLASAGKTFIGMGMMLAPLVGLAAHSYSLQGRPQLVWLLTSLLCFGLYFHALKRLKTPLLEYIFIGSFVSLFESGISVLHAPLYYYAWGLAVTGLIVQAWALMQNKSLRMEGSAGQSSNLLLPLSVMGSLFLTGQHGFLQLAISSLLAALFYGLQAWRGELGQRPTSAVTAQIALLGSVASFAYAARGDLTDVALALSGAGVLQLLVSMFAPLSDYLERFAYVAAASLIVAPALAWNGPYLSVAALLFLALFSLVTWRRFQKPDLYALGIAAGVLSIFVAAGHAAQPNWPVKQLIAVTFVAALGQIGLFWLARGKLLDSDNWRNVWRGSLLVTFAVICMQALDASHVVSLVCALVIAIICYGLYAQDGLQKLWLIASSGFSFWPVFVASSNHDWWLVALLIAFGWNLILVLHKQLEVARWLGSIAWILLPAAAVPMFANQNRPQWYAVSYLLATAGFVAARAIAQKRIAGLPVSLTELQARLQTDSLVYVIGYGLAAAASIFKALEAGHNTAAILCAMLTGLLYYVGKYVEKQPLLLALVPFGMQVALWLTRSPELSLAMYAAISSALAVILYGYLWLVNADQRSAPYHQQLVYGTLLTLYIAPASFTLGHTFMVMPISLMIAGLVTLHAVWPRQQAYREAAGAAVAMGGMWLVWHLGVHNLQVYTHILAALAGLYSYWRYKLLDKQAGYGYLITMLLTASVPLALQVLSGSGGGLYGWWFIGEQIAIMLLGMAISNKLVTRWGLYASVAAVLYQLRVLPWLSLSLLAAFLIGLAIYQLQKQK